MVCSTPADIGALIPIACQVVRARYGFVEDPSAPLTLHLDAFLVRIAGQ